MDKNLQDKIKEGEKQHKKHLRLFEFAEGRIEAGKRSFAPFTDIGEVGLLRSVWNASKRIIFFFILLIITEKFGTSLLIYAGLNLFQLLAGLIVRNVNAKALDAMQSQWSEIQEDYYKHVALQWCIDPEDKMCHYDDGINVWSGGVNIPIDGNYGEVNVYNALKNDMMQVLNYREFQGYTDDYWLKNEIASVEFKEKYTVITAGDNRLNAVALVSPAFQVCLLDDPYISQYHSFHTRQDRMMMETPFGVADYELVSMYMHRSLQDCFASVDTYCETLRRTCDAVHAQVQALPVLQKAR